MLTNKDAKYFFDVLSKLPRGEGAQGVVQNFLIRFATERGLDVYFDSFSNILISKIKDDDDSSIAFCVNAELINKRKPSIFFNKQNYIIKCVKKGDYIFAKGATLSAQTLGGMALCLELLDSEQISNIEVLFVAQNSGDMLGVKGFDVKKLKSKKLICLVAGEKNAIFKSSPYASSNLLKFNNDRKFIKNSWQLKTFKLTIDNLPKHLSSYQFLADLLIKIPNVNVNKFMCGCFDGGICKNEMIFTTDISEIQLKSIIKEIYIQIKKDYPNFILKCFRQINQTLVMSNRDMIQFVSQFEQGQVKSQEGVFQNITSANIVSGFVNFDLLAKDEKTLKKYFDTIRSELKKQDIDCIMIDEVSGFVCDDDSKLLEMLTKTSSLPVEDYLEKCEAGIFKEKIKGSEVAILSFEVENKNQVDEKLKYSSFVNTSVFLKEFINNFFAQTTNN